MQRNSIRSQVALDGKTMALTTININTKALLTGSGTGGGLGVIMYYVLDSKPAGQKEEREDEEGERVRGDAWIAWSPSIWRREASNARQGNGGALIPDSALAEG